MTSEDTEMANTSSKPKIPMAYYVISLTSAIVVGVDVALVSYLYTYISIGIAGGLLIALAGFLLNTYVYFETGPESIQDLLSSSHTGLLPRIVDMVSILGAVLIGFFTVFAYQQMIVEYAFLGIWFTPFFVFSMTAAYVIATFTLNKSGLLTLLNQGYSSLSEFYDEFIKLMQSLCRWDDKSASVLTRCYEAMVNIILPLSVGLIVTIAYTSTFLMGALSLVSGLSQAWFLVPFVWLTGISFFIGELYFNCNQNLELIASAKKGVQFSYTLTSIVVLLVVIANAVANAFIAMDGPLVMMGLWGGLKFFSGGFQSFFTMSNKCIVQFESWDSITGGKPFKVLAFSILSLAVISIVYIGFIYGVVEILPWLAATGLYTAVLYQMFINSSADTNRDDEHTSHKSTHPASTPISSKSSLSSSPSFLNLKEESVTPNVSPEDERGRPCTP